MRRYTLLLTALCTWMLTTAQSLTNRIDVLLGDALGDRKNFIAENGAKYLDMADIS